MDALLDPRTRLLRMTPTEIYLELQREWGRRLNGWCPHSPTARQAAFLAREEREILFGGAAGGGKSDALLMDALQYVHVPGYAHLILRRTFKDLAKPGAIMDRAIEWLMPRARAGLGVRWSGDLKAFYFDTWHTLSSGECVPAKPSVLAFGHLESENDKFQYQGGEFQGIGFDELTQFTETQYTYLLSRIRRPKMDALPPDDPLRALARVPLRMRAGANPGGEGHEWVYARFVNEKTRQPGRGFVPAKLTDNPHLDQAEYEGQLDQLDHVTREQLKNGRWDVRPGGKLFKREWFKLIDLEQVPSEVRASAVRYWDFAATAEGTAPDPDFTRGALVGFAPDPPRPTDTNPLPPGSGDYYVLDVQGGRLSPSGSDDLVEATAKDDGRAVPVVIEQEPGSAGVKVIEHYRCNVLGPRYEVIADKKTGSKYELAKPFSVYAERGRVFFVRGPWTEDALQEFHGFPQKGLHDDYVDAITGAARHAVDRVGAVRAFAAMAGW
jgi:predicted phage terminase large subunit-like protein